MAYPVASALFNLKAMESAESDRAAAPCCGVEVAAIECIVKLFDYAPIILGSIHFGMWSLLPDPKRTSTVFAQMECAALL